MNLRSPTQTKTTSSFLPIQTGILQRKCNSCGQHTIAGGTCINCQQKSGLQRKLKIGASNDLLELEADQVADRVMAASANSVVSSAPPRIQRFTGQTTEQADMAAPASVDSVLSSPGSPLEPELQQDMGQRFGHDFSRVRVHTDHQSAQLNRQLNAQAFTHNQEIYFGAGKQPGNNFLTAHELAHVIQQQTGAVSAGLVQCSEKDPDEVAAAAKEDAAIVAVAKRALKSKNPAIAVQEVMWRLITNNKLDIHFELSGSKYEKTQKGIKVQFPPGKGVRTQGTIIAGDEVLQRLANGELAKVVEEIAAQIGKVDTARGTIDYVFIMGKDVPKSNNKFYTEAKIFFKAEYPTATMVEDVRDLDGIMQRINAGGKPVANLYVVSHAHPDGTLQFSINPADKTPRQVQYSELKEANNKQSLTKPQADLVGFWTNIQIRGCNLGRSEEMLKEFRTAFGGKARVIAPTHAQRYGSGKESLAEPFYEEPGISKLTDKQAFDRIKAKPEYAFITDWKAMRSKLKRFNDSSKEIVYEGKFPEPGKDMDLLKSERGAAEAKKYTAGARRIDGTETVFNFIPNNATKNGPIEIRIETPPDEKTAIAMARATVARPDAYAYTVHNQRNDLNLKVIVDIQRTEWELHHAEIHKQGKGFNPSPGTKPWFGDTE